MRIAVFSTKPYDRQFLEAANGFHDFKLKYFETRLTSETVQVAAGYDGVCVFVNDVLDAEVIERLSAEGVKLIALRCAGFNNVNLHAAEEHGMTVVRVPAYSPYAVAEHTVAMMLSLNRKIYRAHNRVREGNFSLDGLLGFDLHGQTVGVIGTGQIGQVVIRIMAGFGCKVLAYDPYPNPEVERLGGSYVALDDLLTHCDIITLHCPLTPETRHLIDAETLAVCKDGVMIVNTSRGALIDALDVIEALKSGRIGYLGLDVYEEEADVFFEDLSGQILKDDTLARLMTFPNVLITSHQAFFTRNALQNIAETTMRNIALFAAGKSAENAVGIERVKR
ncbi:MAG: 2-hydroxyacid dehydrogenase [Chloroflexi bacterium]|nr:2-hydroxyacid dehydrogenase [Chloroflexota bacterium]